MEFKKLLFNENERCNEKLYEEYWQQLFFMIIALFLSVCGLPLVIIGAITFIKSDVLIGVVLNPLLYFAFVVTIFSKRINIKIRYSLCIYFMQLISFFLLFFAGAASAWPFFIMLSYVAAGFLLRQKYLSSFIVINVILFSMTTVFITSGSFPNLKIHDYDQSWMVVILSCMAIGINLIVLLNHTIKGIVEQGKASKNREEFLIAATNSNHDGLIIVDINGAITHINPSGCELLEKPEEYFIGKFINDALDFYDAYSDKRVLAFEEFMDKEKGVLNHIFYRNSSNEEIIIILSYAVILTKDIEKAGMIFSIHDTTKLRIIEEKIKQTQKLQAMGTLAGGVAHDFNNMLGGIMGYAQLLEKMNNQKLGYKDNQMALYIDEVIKTVEKASDLTRQLLAYARKEEIRYQNIDINNCIKSAVRLLNRTTDKRISIFLNLEETNPIIFGDESLLQNVFLNICLNARDAMPQGGQLIIESRLTQLDKVFCKEVDFDLFPGEYLKIVFSDTGEGIEPKIYSRIFEPFFTTKAVGEGTGLGLSESYGTIVAHGGAILVQSEIAVGSKFIIYLPVSKEVDRNKELPEINVEMLNKKDKPLPRIKRTILIIDDEPVMRSVTQLYFRDLGFNVIVADNGIAGIEIFKEKHYMIDIVLLDMIMPKMNGAETFMNMKKIDNEVKVIILSGFTEDEKVSELLKLGAVGFYKKPFRLEAIAQLINKLV